jgi:hypothetical protein
MQALRAILTLVMLSIFSIVADAQSGAIRFSSLPAAAQSAISSTLASEVPGVPWPQLAKLTASDGQSGVGFGVSIAISGDTVVVGISVNYLHEAYVFVKPSTGWADMTQTAILTPSDDSYSFGYAVGISGDTIVVGAVSPANAYVYVRPKGGWRNMTETAELASQSDGIFELGISGDTLGVSSAYNGGVSYVFVKPRRGWKSTSQANATLTTPFYGGFCQWCVAVSGDTIAVGTPGSFGSEGTVYIFVKPSGGWRGDLNPTATMIASNGKFSDQLGISVAVNGDTVVAGANGVDLYSGAVYVFEKPAGGWKDMSETAELTAPDSIDLGWSVAVCGNRIVGGAFYTTVGSNQFQGAAFLYVRPKSGWKTTHKFSAELTSSGGMPNDQFGASVGISGKTAVAGAPDATIGSNSSQGAAYVFAR